MIAKAEMFWVAGTTNRVWKPVVAWDKIKLGTAK